MKATNIKWDVENEEDLQYLPTEIDIPDEIADDYDRIDDYLSDISGYCHTGYNLENEQERE